MQQLIQRYPIQLSLPFFSQVFITTIKESLQISLLILSKLKQINLREGSLIRLNSLLIKNEIWRRSLIESYLGPCQTSLMDLFCENS